MISILYTVEVKGFSLQYYEGTTDRFTFGSAGRRSNCLLLVSSSCSANVTALFDLETPAHTDTQRHSPLRDCFAV